MERIELPDIEGITIPKYVKNIAEGKYPDNAKNTKPIPADQPSLIKIQRELVCKKFLVVKIFIEILFSSTYLDRGIIF